MSNHSASHCTLHNGTVCTSIPQFGSFWASFEAWKWTGKHSHKNVWQLGIKPDAIVNQKDMSYFLDNGRPKGWKIIEKELKILPHELTRKLPGVPHFNMLRYVTNYLQWCQLWWFIWSKISLFLKILFIVQCPKCKESFWKQAKFGKIFTQNLKKLGNITGRAFHLKSGNFTWL